MYTVEQIAYGGWEHCYRIFNREIELIFPADIGIRLIHFGFIGKPNVFHQIPTDLGRVMDEGYRFYGGHRLWHAPEHQPRTYHPDNQPISVDYQGELVRLTQPIETSTGIKKTILLHMNQTTRVRVIHRLTNTNLWPITLAPWALSVMRSGGMAILPLPPRKPYSPENLLPTGQMALWSYTDLADARWTFGRQYVLVQQVPDAPTMQKIGMAVSSGWAAYLNQGDLFVKCFTYDPNALYPDRGSNVEVYTDGTMLELETLGPLQTLAPGATLEHIETWQLFRDVPTPTDDAEVEGQIVPLIDGLSHDLPEVLG